MNVKIDTKEKFSVITFQDSNISANMTDELQKLLQSFQISPIPHLVLNMSLVTNIEASVLQMIVEKQQVFYNENYSFVICGLHSDLLTQLDEMELLDAMNVTPTESEAWDIVQMEEIERELLGGFENN
jgi:anti-anti-sigma regulatory factor